MSHTASKSACLNMCCIELRISARSCLSSVAAMGTAFAAAHKGTRAGSASGKHAAAYGYPAYDAIELAKGAPLLLVSMSSIRSSTPPKLSPA